MPALEEFQLTEAEKIAKQKFLLIYKEAYYIPCDIDNIDVRPLWYDDEKYKRGQKYFHENRVGILNSNLIGLICLLSDSKGLQILSSTNNSSTKEAAKKRYISTILHTLSWYEIDLTAGSESRKSLATVRKLHFAASNSANAKYCNNITQAELSYTATGFMGLAITRPHVFGIKSDNQEDREAFVYLWAVICNMIGVKDEYNICLLPYDALEIFCQMIIRYILIPRIQIELPEFKRMTQAMIDGLSEVLPFMNYESQIFTVKLALGLPNYQYKVDFSKVTLCRSILNQKEIDNINKVFNYYKDISNFKLTVDIPIVEIIKKHECETDENKIALGNEENIKSKIVEMSEFEMKFHSLLKLKNTEIVKISYIDYEKEWQNCLNNEKFYQLSAKAQRIIKFKHYGRILVDYRISKYLIDVLMDFTMNRLKMEGHLSNSSTVDIKLKVSNDVVEYKLLVKWILYPLLKLMIKTCEYFKKYFFKFFIICFVFFATYVYFLK